MSSARASFLESAVKHKATAPEPSVDPPVAIAKSMVSAKVDI